MIVVDSSVIVHFILHSTESEELSAIIAKEDRLAAPALIDLEVLNTLRKHVQFKQISPQVAELAVAHYQEINIELYDMRVLIRRVWDFRYNVTAYDAAYLALAESLGVALLTRDARLFRGAPETISVRLV